MLHVAAASARNIRPPSLSLANSLLAWEQSGNISQTPCWVPMTVPPSSAASRPNSQWALQTTPPVPGPCRVLGTQGSQDRGGFLLQGPYRPAHAAGFASFPSNFSKLLRDRLTEAYCVVGHQPFQCLWESDGRSSAWTCRLRLSHLGRLGTSGWPSIRLFCDFRSMSRSRRILGWFLIM